MSRQAKEMLVGMMLEVLIMMMMAVVEVICHFVEKLESWNFWATLALEMTFQTPLELSTLTKD